jgi:capsid portal protein
MSDREVVLKAVTVDLTADSGGSTQPNDAGEWIVTPRDCIEPPESLDRLAALTQINPTRRPALDALALNSVGLGYTIEVATGHERDVTDHAAMIAAATQALERAARRDSVLERPSFTELIKAAKYDEEEVGQGCIELSRDKRTGKVDGLYHVPGKRVRRLKDRTGYLLLPPSGDEDKAVRFYNFGEKVKYDRNDQPTNRLVPGRRWAQNELMVLRLYTSESRDYGLPRDAANAIDYLGDKNAAEANVSFFDSSGTPPTVLFVQGEEQKSGAQITFTVPQQTSDRIADTMSAEGAKRKRVAIIPVPPGTNVKDVQLGGMSDRDVGNIAYRADNRARAMASFRLQPIFLGVNDEGRYDAEVQRAITLEQVFDPEQTRYEGRMADVIADMGFPLLRLNFKRLAVEGDAQRRESTERSAEVGAVTRREFRTAHGLAPLPEAPPADTPITWHDGRDYKSAEPEPGQVPFGWNDGLITPPATPGAPPPGAPEGAQNRVNAANDQRGLRPGVGGRTSRDKTAGQPRHVEQAVTTLQAAAGAAMSGAAKRATARANGS